jgi:exopolysaccharide biosynthesis WecB/TagA/CpsF family protein
MNMLWQERWRNLLNHTRRVATPGELRPLLDTLTNPADRHVLAFVNAHAMNSSAESTAFYEALRSANTLLRDGSGMALLYRLLGMQAGVNLNGTDLIPQIIRRFNGRPIALYGTREPYLSKAAHVVSETLARDSKITLADGFSDANAYIEFARAQRPTLIVLGMGMPKQELVASQLRGSLDFPCLIVCGGAIVDFLGGKTRRAPSLIQTFGLEWVFRLMLEPRRLFVRYVVGNPKFIFRSIYLSRFSRQPPGSR